LANGGAILDYLEGVGYGKPLIQPSRPLIAVPTTAGTGSEATKNAVIGNEARTFKKSMRADGMLPVIALVDPELTYDCPAEITAASGMDALTQLLEAFTSRQSNPMVDTLAGLGLGMASHLPRLADDPRDGMARESMSMASLLGGIALANAGLGAVHGLASPIGAFYSIPHGAICAALLPAVVKINAEKAFQSGNRRLLEKYCTAAIQIVSAAGPDMLTADQPFEELAGKTGPSNNILATTMALSCYLKALNEYLGLRGLGHYGIRGEDFPKIIAGARGASMKTNPLVLGDEDLERILECSLEW
jgi:alcohol dehydrogenase class IV